MTVTTGRSRGRGADEGTAVLPFVLEETRYCVRADRVRAILSVDDGSALDRSADPWHAGEISLDGERVRVVDLGRVLQPTRRSTDAAGHVLLFADADDDGMVYGWLVDDVDEPTSVDPDAVERPKTLGRFVLGHVEDGPRELIWLDDRAIND